MKYCIVEIITQTATFRNPEFQNFHKTLYLPPPSTIVGLTGAALGLSNKQSYEFFQSNKIRIGVYGESNGITKDLWKYKKSKGERSIINKEILFKNEFFILFVSEDDKIIDQIENSFKYPIYALTMGNSDSLAFIKKIHIGNIDKFNESLKLEYCLAEGDIIKECLNNVQNGLEFSIYNTSDPIVYDLPVLFNFESDYGVRSISKRKTFSFVGKEMNLNTSKQGIIYKNVFIPILNLFD